MSHEAGAVVKQEGKPNDLIERIRADSYFEPIWQKLDEVQEPVAIVEGQHSLVINVDASP